MDILKELYSVITDRKENPTEGSYTNYLFDKGTDKISKKLGEEAVEVVIAASQRDRKATIQEIADLEYHLLVLMVDRGITLDDVEAELRSRRS
ncbi:MAG: phosphoribosyl-ATP diphosphatase [Clostridiales bacterium]|jgi:phosphoribosyl-ATP pyrophosphohydrolase/phosphoribosyl-ATP pyrophosphohydrolase/phosphoribosyl-AMP cyclohydrolase|nr:phosphoribosyl-ATP diphosphatase [Clostridiales bacterium]MBQ2605271.1 phosphoribosyl-ATP diphosphatase [Clostridiales bacterium]MBQ4191683.1 phosphoribosyl-ATP diphosphatase [Clostridiales bacterium]MBQ4216658.1 phosphoribosyl-ATP diphosphatase [Clostridiales bacterium]MBQ5423260.1 phosphoribosyl-ATP diphosphatase [Clostridiales bacterium]